MNNYINKEKIMIKHLHSFINMDYYLDGDRVQIKERMINLK